MNKARTIFRFGFALIRLCPGRVTRYVLLSLVTQTAIPLTLPVLLGKLTNGINSPAQRTNYLIWLLLTFALVPMTVWFRVAQAKMDGQMEKEVRHRLFEKVIRQAPEFFHRYNPGELTNVLTQMTIEAQQALKNLTLEPLLQLVSLVIAMVLIVSQFKHLPGGAISYVVAIMIVVGLASAWAVRWKGDQPVDKVQREVQQQRFALAGLADSAVRSPEEIQAMGAEMLFSHRHEQALERFIRLKVRQILTMEVVNSAIGLPTQIILAALFGLIVYQSIGAKSGFPPGVFITIAGLTPQLMQPFRSFAMLGIMASASWPAIEVVSQLLEEENRIKDFPGATDVEQLDPTLEVRHVHFTYPSAGKKVFDDLSFSVLPARITGLVARMGQGKTTFFRLALRFYDPQEGDIVLGGHSTSFFTLRSLRRHAVLMSQFPAFFHDTVRDNFRVAKPDATDEEIRRLSEQTRLWPILESAVGSDPLNQPLAAGMGLSGGQKKLFALTRCLLRNPTFLFLDEPTTGMSNDEKYLLIPMMREACAGKTVVVVDHDIPWMIRFCDSFVVIDSGQVVEQGEAKQLLAQPGVLRELYTLAVPADPVTSSV